MTKKADRVARAVLDRMRAHRYHLLHRQQATGLVKSVESERGKTDPKFIDLSNQYARDVLGSRNYAPWLYAYSALAGCFKEGWIPDNYYGWIVVPAKGRDYLELSSGRALNYKLFRSDLFPDLVYSVNGLFYTRDYVLLRYEELKEYLFDRSDVVVFKSDSSGQGKGVVCFEAQSFEAAMVQSLGNGVFQHYIKQHRVFEEVMPDSAATIRITSVLDDQGDTSVRACFVGFGRSGETNMRSATITQVPVNTSTGELDPVGYLRNWHRTDRHPDTQVVFANRQIPGFEKCLAAALDLHKLVPYDRCIGWDMTVDKDENVQVLEWNGNHNGIKTSEPVQGPGFKDMGWEKLWNKH
jgi:hypothetical protein